MKPILSTAWILGATLAGVGGLLACAPFDSARGALEKMFAAGPAWAQVRSVYVDPTTQEVSHGENPSRSLDILRTNWSEAAQARIVFVGNSQMFSVSLAPGEAAPAGLEKTYPDIVANQFSGAAKCYRLAAPAISRITPCSDSSACISSV